LSYSNRGKAHRNGATTISINLRLSSFGKLLDAVPLSGSYPARLALEQLYGSMVRNGKAYGILTTMKGWCFLRRANGGRLYITPMFGDFEARQGISPGADLEGYYVPQGFSIMQALYYLSAIAETTPNLPETPTGGLPGQVTLPQAGNSTAAAPTIQQLQAPNQGAWLGAFAPAHGGQGHQVGNEGVQILGGYDQSQCARYDAASEFKGFQFESWIPENNLGPKTWIAIALPVQSKVVLKLWDGEEAETVRPLPICTCDRFGESTSLRCS
jgi:hypothetical protein